MGPCAIRHSSPRGEDAAEALIRRCHIILERPHNPGVKARKVTYAIPDLALHQELPSYCHLLMDEDPV